MCYVYIPLISILLADVPEAVSLFASTGSSKSKIEVRSCSNDTEGPIIRRCYLFMIEYFQLKFSVMLTVLVL